MTNVKQSILWRATFCLVAVLVFAFWIAGRMFTIQIAEGEELLAKSDSLTIITQDISPSRGNIYSDNGALLATSMPNYSIHWDATIVNSDTFNRYVNELAVELANLFKDKPAAAYRDMLKTAKRDEKRYQIIHRKVNYHDQKAMRSFPIFNKGRYRGGFIAQQTTKRVKPAGQLAFRTIGYRTKNNPGVGLERSFESQLGGVKGSRLAQKISGGYRPLNDENLLEPENGRDVHTTINVDFQEITQRALSAALEQHKAEFGSVIVMEVKTGRIKAISNLKYKGDGKFIEDYNYAIGEKYEPGSVFKVFSAMAAFEDKVVDENDTINIRNGYREFGKDNTPMIDSDRGRYKKLSVIDGFAKSSNVLFSSIIDDNFKSNPAKFINYLKKLDLHEPTGIEILGESQPVLNQPSSEQWSDIALPWLAVGYENEHTALQLLTAYNGIINGGSMVEPYLVEKVTDAGIVVEDYSVDRETSKVCSEETSDKILRLTKATVDYGTARNIRSSVVTLAGKTGTAQIASKSGYQKYKQYNASFVGHFPAEEPVYSVYVMVHKPSNGTFYATWVAAPIFKEIAEKIYTISVKEPVEKAEKASNPAYTAGYYSDLKRISTVLGKSMPDDVYADVVEIIPSSLAVRPITNSNNKMPNTKGMGARDVMYLLESMGLKVKISGTGSVVKQSPIPGTLVKPNRTVYIRLN